MRPDRSGATFLPRDSSIPRYFDQVETAGRVARLFRASGSQVSPACTNSLSTMDLRPPDRAPAAGPDFSCRQTPRPYISSV